MTIKEVCEKYDITPDTLRYYERVGVIPEVSRTAGGIRNYTQTDFNWVENAICMRGAGGDDTKVDETAATEMTAGKFLSRYPRDTYYLATKFPGYDNSNMPKVKEIFEKQLEKLQTEYLDFYLFHNVYEGNIDDYLDPKFGIFDYLMEQKKNGRIKHLGFSAHGSVEVIKRFLQAIPEVTMVLSGMSNMDQLKANMKTFETDEPLTAEEFEKLVTLADEETAQGGLPCPTCHYCTTHCPQELPIPELIALYNEHKITGGGFLAPMGMASMPAEKRPKNCVGCRSCEQVCPQQIKISEMMTEFSGMIGM